MAPSLLNRSCSCSLQRAQAQTCFQGGSVACQVQQSTLSLQGTYSAEAGCCRWWRGTGSGVKIFKSSSGALSSFTPSGRQGQATSSWTLSCAASAARSPVKLGDPGGARSFVESKAAQSARSQAWADVHREALLRQTNEASISARGSSIENGEQAQDVLGAWRAEIFGVSSYPAPQKSRGSPLLQGSSAFVPDVPGGTLIARRELQRGALKGSEVELNKEGGAVDPSSREEDEVLAASVYKGSEEIADGSKASGPPAREVLAGLKTPPWKGKLLQESKKDAEGPVPDEGSIWRQERLQRYLENKARLQASRAAESSGRGPRKDMARVRKSRGLEGLGAGRKHSQLGHVTVARAAMLAELSGDVHEAIKRSLSEETGDKKLPQGEEAGRAERMREVTGGLEDSERGEGAFEEEVAARTPSLVKAALEATSVAELREAIEAHEAATLDALDAENGSVLVRELSWVGKVDLASHVFQTLCETGNEPSASACHELIVGAHRKDDFRLTLKAFAMSRVRGIVPKRTTCMAAIESCHRLGRWREAKAFFSDMGRCGLEPDTLAYNALLMTLGGARETREVRELWQRMTSAGVQANQQTYGLLISTFTKANCVDDALEIYERLTKEGFQPTGLMYEGLIVLLSRSKRDRMALNFYQEMRFSGFVLSPRGHAVLLGALAKGWVLDWESALEVYTNMKADNIPLDIHHLTALLKVLALSRQTQAALETWKEFLDAGVQPDLSCYNSMIGALRVVYDYDTALKFFWQMKDSGLCPNQETYGNLLWACTEPALSKTALKIFEDMKESGVKPNTHAFTALFTVMGRAGEWQTALELWKEMRNHGIKPRTKTYNAMIGCLGRCRKAELMLKAHKQMLDEGIQPDDTTRHFLGKFGPPGTSQSSQPWGRGNLMGQRIELKHYGRGNDLGTETSKEAAPEAPYKRPGVLHAMKGEDNGWVRPDRERQLVEERRRMELVRAENEGGSGFGKSSQEPEELEWVSEAEEEGLHDHRSTRGGLHPSAERESLNGGTGWKGGRERLLKQEGSLGNAAPAAQNGSLRGDGRKDTSVEGIEKELMPDEGEKKEKKSTKEDEVPLWQII